MDVVTAIRVGYLLAAVATMVIYAIPPVRDRFLVYGPRDQINDTQKLQEGNHSSVRDLLDRFAAIKVPHSWFKHFYIVSVLSSLLWLHQLYTRGPMLQYMLSITRDREQSMSFSQLALCWTLLAVQGSRRLYECIVFAKPSLAQMWIGHYILGLLYYLAMGVAIWIEGSPALLSTEIPLGNASISAPSISTFVFLPVFLVASSFQYEIHSHLTSLRKYTIPSHPFFERIISPHYTAEVAIYLCLCFLAAPRDHLVNMTVLAAFIFVVVELGVSADVSKKWYMRKFDRRLFEHRWRMIPGLW